jgi:hypothetical protein
MDQAMAVTLSARAQRAMSLDEYMSSLEKHVDAEDDASILATAWRLHALSLNGSLLVSALNRFLERADASGLSESSPHPGAPHAIILGTTGRFTVKASIWPAVRSLGVPHRRTDVKNPHAEGILHSHNFSFMTFGWFGPGCPAEIYEYDGRALSGDIGEPVPLRLAERTTLSQGKLMYFREDRDAHAQHAPESTSVSLSLLIEAPHSMTRDQYVFDPDRQCIRGHVGDSAASRAVTAVRAASWFPTERNRALLSDVASLSPAARVRTAARKALAQLGCHVA